MLIALKKKAGRSVEESFLNKVGDQRAALTGILSNIQ